MPVALFAGLPTVQFSLIPRNLLTLCFLLTTSHQKLDSGGSGNEANDLFYRLWDKIQEWSANEATESDLLKV